MRSYLEEVDIEKIKLRFDGFWQRETIDRPLIYLTAPRKRQKKRNFSIPDSLEKRWTDIEYILNEAELRLENTLFLGDAIPFYMPTIGPDSLTAYLGGDLTFNDENTSWAKPFVNDLSEYNPVFDTNNKWWRFMSELIDAICKVAEGNFLVGIPDIHGGADSLVAARGGKGLLIDLYDKPEEVKRIMKRLTRIYCEIFDLYYQKISSSQEGSTTWIRAYSRGKYVALQNDFSGLISPKMFEEFFLYEVRELSEHVDNSIYHLDGPSALGNLEYLLSIDTLDGIQWVPGAGAKPMKEWIGVCNKVLNSGKCLQISCRPDEVEFLVSMLKTAGLFLRVHCNTEDEARQLFSKVKT